MSTQTTTTQAASGAEELTPEMIAAARAEYDRWSTAADTSRPKGQQDWVCRQDDAGTWQVISYHDFGKSDRSRHDQALVAALTAALTTGAAR